MTMLGRASPTLSSECIFEPIEWQTAYVMLYEKSPLSEVPTLKDTLKTIAQLGGFIGRKDDGTQVLYKFFVTPQLRHPERVFLREGSPCSSTVFNISIDINRPTQDSMH